ncbi:MAG: 16S rRNA (guanine(527)-N(7))-methyltransferase RsmG [Nitrospirae bacterium]|nr:16S rRNA (guanine(527)-N(7))-methyltransferase RsmG [Nitrospirota bacterium]
MIKKPDELIRDGLVELGLIPSKEQINAFMVYLSELKKWNKAYNLTGLRKDEDIIIKHFLDSLLYLKAIPDGKIKVTDVGSGAGVPGIPIKIIRPEIEMYLIEPSRKKTAFLRHIIKQLGLKKIEVIEKRIEEIQESGFSVDVAVTRALFNIKDFVKKASPVVREGGYFILSKGPKVKEELSKIKIKRIKDITIFELSLPLVNTKRFIVMIEK